jgi:para-nitrobenzyl esterase
VRTGDWDGVYDATRFGNRAFQPLRRTAVETSEAATEHGNGGWLYRFDIPTTVLDGRLGATHACEIAFTFNWFDSDDAALRMHEATPTNTAVARRWSDTLIQFARTGDPNRAGLPQWSPYSTAERACMMLDDECHIEHDPDGEHRGLWQS